MKGLDNKQIRSLASLQKQLKDGDVQLNLKQRKGIGELINVVV